jgi:hypothetical protein
VHAAAAATTDAAAHLECFSLSALISCMLLLLLSRSRCVSVRSHSLGEGCDRRGHGSHALCFFLFFFVSLCVKLKLSYLKFETLMFEV